MLHLTSSTWFTQRSRKYPKRIKSLMCPFRVRYYNCRTLYLGFCTVLFVVVTFSMSLFDFIWTVLSNWITITKNCCSNSYILNHSNQVKYITYILLTYQHNKINIVVHVVLCCRKSLTNTSGVLPCPSADLYDKGEDGGGSKSSTVSWPNASDNQIIKDRISRMSLSGWFGIGSCR